MANNQYKLVKPCEFELLRRSETPIKASLHNLYGLKKDVLVEKNSINLKNNPKGAIMILKATVKGKTISKMIIID